jgi:hypothetical protein
MVLLCECPVGRGTGRPSKALTLTQAEAVLREAEESPMRGYIVTGLLTGLADRGTASAHVVSRRPGRRPGRDPASATEHQGLALSTRRRGNQDTEVSALPRLPQRRWPRYEPSERW